MKPTILIIVLFSANLIFGQKDSEVDNRFSINIAPLSLIDVYGGISYRIGAECKIYKNIACTAEFGKYFTYGSHTKGFFKINPKGFIIRTSVKYYLNDEQLTVRDYWAIEYLYKNITFDYRDSIQIDPDPVFQKQYTIHKNISALTVKYGFVKILKNRFVIDCYAGIGVRVFMNGHTTLTPEEEAGLLTGENHGGLIGDGQRVYKKMVIPNVSIGVKLGFRIK